MRHLWVITIALFFGGLSMRVFLSPVCPIRLNEKDQDFVASDQIFCCYLVYFCSCIVTLRDCLPFSVHKMEIGKKSRKYKWEDVLTSACVNHIFPYHFYILCIIYYATITLLNPLYLYTYYWILLLPIYRRNS